MQGPGLLSHPSHALCAACCSAGAAAIARFPWDAEIRDFAAAPIDVFDGLDFAMVPWTMITGPDGNLFVATDVNYTVRSSCLDTSDETKPCHHYTLRVGLQPLTLGCAWCVLLTLGCMFVQELLSHHSTKGEIVKLVLTDQGTTRLPCT